MKSSVGSFWIQISKRKRRMSSGVIQSSCRPGGGGWGQSTTHHLPRRSAPPPHPPPQHLPPPEDQNPHQPCPELISPVPSRIQCALSGSEPLAACVPLQIRLPSGQIPRQRPPADQAVPTGPAPAAEAAEAVVPALAPVPGVLAPAVAVAADVNR